jgi:hypothetical protein
MASLIHLELLTDFFNKIGPSRHFKRRALLVVIGCKDGVIGQQLVDS